MTYSRTSDGIADRADRETDQRHQERRLPRRGIRDREVAEARRFGMLGRGPPRGARRNNGRSRGPAGQRVAPGPEQRSMEATPPAADATTQAGGRDPPGRTPAAARRPPARPIPVTAMAPTTTPDDDRASPECFRYRIATPAPGVRGQVDSREVRAESDREDATQE